MEERLTSADMGVYGANSVTDGEVKQSSSITLKLDYTNYIVPNVIFCYIFRTDGLEYLVRKRKFERKRARRRKIQIYVGRMKRRMGQSWTKNKMIQGEETISA